MDRHARSSVAAKASWINTWRRFHMLAFAEPRPPVPMLPVTPRSLVLVASLFKSGGYRGFPNYLSAVNALHIEAGHDWDQLLTHTGGWVTRSVARCWDSHSLMRPVSACLAATQLGLREHRL